MARASIGSGTVVDAGAIVHPAVTVGKTVILDQMLCCLILSLVITSRLGLEAL